MCGASSAKRSETSFECPCRKSPPPENPRITVIKGFTVWRDQLCALSLLNSKKKKETSPNIQTELRNRDLRSSSTCHPQNHLSRGRCRHMCAWLPQREKMNEPRNPRSIVLHHRSRDDGALLRMVDASYLPPKSQASTTSCARPPSGPRRLKPQCLRVPKTIVVSTAIWAP